MTYQITPEHEDVAVGQVRRLPIRLPSTDIEIEVVVLDARTSFGRKDWQVAPVAGTGDAWVAEATLKGTSGGVKPISEADQKARAKA